MDETARIGPSIRIKGEISAKEPMIVEGRVEGSIDLSGQQLTVSEAAHIDGDVVAHTVVVAGTVKGTLSAEAKVILKQTASLEGEMTAPAVKVDEGAVLQGRVEVGGRRQLAVAV
jgi:cytoskeletal protein CcmA (bactofilin family)